MTAMPPLRDILNNTPVDATDVDFNFGTIEAHIGSEMINRDGSVAMTGPLSLAGPPTAPQHAASKAYVDSPNVIPIGTIWEFAGAAAPAGWALCDGTSKTITDPLYAALFAVIGYAFGGAGQNFLLPDRRGRVGVGRIAGDALFDHVGQAGGSRDLILPSHNHPIPQHIHGIADHLHSLAGHVHRIQHRHDLSGHVHQSPLRRGFDVNSAGAPGMTNAIYTPSGVPLQFTTRPTAQTEDAGGGAQFNTGAPLPNWSDFMRDGPNNEDSGGPNVPNTGGMTAATNTGLGGFNADTVGVAPANANIPPYVTVNFIIRIG